MAYHIKDLTGQTFGRLTVIKQAPNHGRRVAWECQCSCGKKTVIISVNLVAGYTKSCGCINRELRTKPPGVAALNVYYKQYKRNAEIKGLIFEFTLQEFKQLTEQNCFYCGQPPSIKYAKSTTPCFINGIDRINNSMGYLLNNCVACCSVCNYMKRDMTKEYFMEHVRKIAIHSEKNAL